MRKLETPWSLKLMGKFELRNGDDEVVHLPTKKVALLLAYLALDQQEDLSRERISEAIWPESSPKAARDSLRTALATLRSKIPEGCITTTKETIKLLRGAIDVIDQPDEDVDFLPEFDSDWVVEIRLSRRETHCARMLEDARRLRLEGELAGAMDQLAKILALDPLNEPATRERVGILEETGHRSEAVRVFDSFQLRSVRELGVLPSSEPSKLPEPTSDHPLFSAAEWLLEWNPAEVIHLLAATRLEWTTLPIDRALSIHVRAMEHGSARSVKDSGHERSLVEAQTYYLYAIAGRLNEHISTADGVLHHAIKNQELEVAGRLAFALAYGSLSLGRFKEALTYARASVDCLSNHHDESLKLESRLHLGTILSHVGYLAEGDTMLLKCFEEVETHASPLLVAGANVQVTEIFSRQGDDEHAILAMEKAKRIYTQSGANRMQAWIMFQEAMLHCRMGDKSRGRQIFENIQALGREFAGHSVLAVADDILGALNLKLGDLSGAAEAVGRAAQLRRTVNTVPSVKEKARVVRTTQTLRERLDTHTLSKYSLSPKGI